MGIKVKLNDIIQEIECQIDEYNLFLNTKTGKIVMISNDEFRAAENDKVIQLFPEWQREAVKQAREVLEEDYFLNLPSKYDIDEYGIMEDFCLSLEDDKLRDIMCDVIQGRGAFKRFKENIRRYDIEEEWYTFKDKAYKQIAIEWCEDNGISFEE